MPQDRLVSHLTLALAGEIGEAANIWKKIEIGKLGKALALPMFKEEIADVEVYLFLLKQTLELDTDAILEKKLRERDL